MAFISDQELQEVRSRADIVQVIGEKIHLKKAGRHFKGCCPFHQEKTPSFMVNPEKQIYHCFGCGMGGDIFSFLMKHDGMEFVEAVRTLAERCGVTLTESGSGSGVDAEKARSEKAFLYKVNAFASRFFYETLVKSDSGQRGRSYLATREIRDSLLQEALLGYAPGEGRKLTRLLAEKNIPMESAAKLGLVRKGDSRGDYDGYYDFFRDRLIFSIVSADGKVLGFSGRVLDGEAQPKYLNSPESPIYHKGDSLLGMQVAKQAIREVDQAILVEGNFDMLRLHQEGLKNVVAPLGTALTELQIRSLGRLTENFVLLFDGDAAGVRASARALEIFLPLGLSPKVVILPQGEDPDSFVKKRGIDPLRELLSVAPSLLEIRVEEIFSTEKGPQGQAKALHRVAELLGLLPGEIEKRLYIQRLSERFGLPVSLLIKEMETKRGDRRNRSNFSGVSSDEERGHVKPVSLPPIERTVLEILLSGRTIPGILLQEIGVQDFSHPDLGKVWGILKGDYQQHGELDLARTLSGLEEGPLRKLLSEVAFTGSFWGQGAGQNELEGTKAATDCVKQFRVIRLKDQLKNLSSEIRRAETEGNAGQMQQLLEEKNQLIQRITSLH